MIKTNKEVSVTHLLFGYILNIESRNDRLALRIRSACYDKIHGLACRECGITFLSALGCCFLADQDCRTLFDLRESAPLLLFCIICFVVFVDLKLIGAT